MLLTERFVLSTENAGVLLSALVCRWVLLWKLSSSLAKNMLTHLSSGQTKRIDDVRTSCRALVSASDIVPLQEAHRPRIQSGRREMQDLQNQRQRLLQTRPNATIFSLTLLHACMKRGCDICMNTPPCYGQRLSASFYAITQPWAITSVCQSLCWYIFYNACLLLDLTPSPPIDNTGLTT